MSEPLIFLVYLKKKINKNNKLKNEHFYPTFPDHEQKNLHIWNGELLRSDVIGWGCQTQADSQKTVVKHDTYWAVRIGWLTLFMLVF